MIYVDSNKYEHFRTEYNINDTNNKIDRIF